ncbi:RNA recognition domain-containing protein [Coniella lustricola]|uniref:RNA recognition domain-containing protein n=1 Tax=Coniella lustricola TaxID=2025994 RepID=A0A2T3AMC4_9PEZI|nr:RNA recognition domain-containing protein [Coniella lustricola]
MSSTVQVKNIAGQTQEKEIRDFFSFCGKITSLEVQEEGETKSATVTFEKDTAAKTALLLNQTQLGSSHITVTSNSGASAEDDSPITSDKDRDSDEITQEEKPRSRIIAEYLAHGYVVGDAAIQQAISLDHQHGVSTRFFNKLTQLDTKYHATDRAKTADQSYGISARATTLFSGLNSYFEKATNTPTGKKLVDFYTQGQKQLQDVHTEARRLAELKKEEHGGSAYKASGLERVFGAEKSGQTEAPSSGPGAPAAPGANTTTETTQPTRAAEGGLGVQESTPIQSEKTA